MKEKRKTSNLIVDYSLATSLSYADAVLGRTQSILPLAWLLAIHIIHNSI